MARRTLCFLVLVCAVFLSQFTPATAVTNGFADGYTHPAVGWVVGIRPAYNECDGFGQAILCSGVLVAPDVFVTTAYCAYSYKEALDSGFINRINVILDPIPNVPGTVTADCTKFTAVSQVHYNPAWETDPFHGNVGVFLLATLQTIAPAQLPTENRLKNLNGKSQWFTVVSMGGVQTASGGTNLTTLARRYAPADIPKPIQVVNPDIHVVKIRPGGIPTQACVRDINQGGATFVKDTNEIISIVDAGSPCTTFGQFQRLDVPGVRSFLSQFVTLP